MLFANDNYHRNNYHSLMIATTKASNGLSELLAGRRTKNGMEISPARTTRKG